jgi:hypothetical protein
LIAGIPKPRLASLKRTLASDDFGSLCEDAHNDP